MQMKLFEGKDDNLIFGTDGRKSIVAEVLGRLFIFVCLLISVFVLGFTITYNTAPVYGVSMQPTLNAMGGTKNDTVYINKFSKGDYGDVIVLKIVDGGETTYIIKRLIGKSGDRINVKADTQGNIAVYRNGKALVENYILDIKQCGDPNNLGMKSTLADFDILRDRALAGEIDNVTFNVDGELVLSDNQVFVLGDNRGYSIDSADDGPFIVDNIEGRVDYILPYGENSIVFFLERFTGIQWLKK